MAIEHAFSPYSDNGGTVVAIAGDDYAILATDTRQSEGMLINSRNVPKGFCLTEKAVLGLSGFRADVSRLVKSLRHSIEMYGYEHEKPLATTSLARLLHTVLYSRRFMPYYTGPILAGLDENGKGAIYRYDPVGSYERATYEASGSAAGSLLSFLDNQVGDRQQRKMTEQASLLPMERALAIVKDAFFSATERDIYTGDHVEIFVITSTGIKKEGLDLKHD